MLNHPFSQYFTIACGMEYTKIEERETFEIVDMSYGHFILPVMWVFEYKFDDDGYLLKFKSRLVARGDKMPPSDKRTRSDTFAARAARALLAIMAAFDLDARHLDGVNAFLNGKLDPDEQIYCYLPDRQALMATGSSFICHQRGHLTKDCPLNPVNAPRPPTTAANPKSTPLAPVSSVQPTEMDPESFGRCRPKLRGSSKVAPGAETSRNEGMYTEEDGKREEADARTVEKRVTLGEVSVLGRKVCLAELDLSKLIGGRAFTVPSQIAFNGYSISTNSLADSGASGSIFIDTQLAIRCCEILWY